MPYDQRYELDILRGTEDPRPWDLSSRIISYSRNSDTLLDIGCGTAYKLIKLAGNVRRIYGLEPNGKMRKKAEENIRDGISNVFLVGGCAENLPFQDNYFDIITCMVAPHDTTEVYRVLKPGGHAILEKIGDRDKWNIKQEFGSDVDGPRGLFSDLEEGGRARELDREFGNLFSEVSVTSGYWKTYYTMKGLILLLEQTPTIRNFNRETDERTLSEIQRRYTTPKGIETTQNRILIIAKK